MLLSVLETLLIALLGGFLFSYLHTPLPWMLGALTTVLLWNFLLKRKVCWPGKFANIGQIIIGYTIGRTFTQETCQQIMTQLPIMLIVTIVTVIFSLLLGYITHKRTGISVESGLIGSIPGGLSQTAVLCAEVPGSDITIVTVMQTARLLSVIFVVPFLAIHGLGYGSLTPTAVSTISTATSILMPVSQKILISGLVILSAILAHRLGMPTPFLLGAVIGTASIGLYGLKLPSLLQYWLDGAQLCIGAYTGARINLGNLSNWRKILPYTLLGVIGLIFCSIGIAFLLMHFHHISLVTAFLSTAPGGMAEMGLTGMMLQADLSVIVAFQLFRLLFILMVLPPVLKWWLARNTANKRRNKQKCG
ncbi:AbrB family transcriptional regulator [Pelosinus sp. sgz500959]|uniref:AbrB family transcriptional regulator n=1 Tax=Pelosinus sp. sgz500959 TaxID=3242472 RepID=UPI003672D406